MRKAVFIALIALAFVLESKVRLLGIRPNLAVLFVYYVGLKHGSSRGALFGALLGAVEDSLAGGMLGPGLLGKATVGYLSPHITGGLFFWSPPLGLIWLALLTMADGVISFACLSVFSHQPASVAQAILAVLLQGILICPAGLLIRPGHED
jgi:rod shape-determining protein MreD